MFKNLTFFISFFFLLNIYSQDTSEPELNFPIFPICKLVPSSLQNKCFNESMDEHIEKYFNYPDLAIDLQLQSVVNVFFEINNEGLVENVFAKSNLVGASYDNQGSLNTANMLFEKSAEEIIMKLPKMIPGKLNDSISSFPFQIPITYRLPSKADDLNKIFSFKNIETAPFFPGCEESKNKDRKTCFKEKIDNHIKKNLRYPKRIKNKKENTVVFVEIIIEKDGKIYDVSILGPDIFRKEVERVIKKIPLLKPALINNVPVVVSYNIPILFKPN